MSSWRLAALSRRVQLLFATQVGLSMVLIPPIVAGFTWILLNTGPWVPFALWYDPFHPAHADLQALFLTTLDC